MHHHQPQARGSFWVVARYFCGGACCCCVAVRPKKVVRVHMPIPSSVQVARPRQRRVNRKPAGYSLECRGRGEVAKTEKGTVRTRGLWFWVLEKKRKTEPRRRLVHFGSPPHRHRQRWPDIRPDRRLVGREPRAEENSAPVVVIARARRPVIRRFVVVENIRIYRRLFACLGISVGLCRVCLCDFLASGMR